MNSRFEKQTPLHFSVISGHKEIAKLLLTNGADVNAKFETLVYVLSPEPEESGSWTPTVYTPLDSAILEGHPEIADLLRKHGGKSGEELKAEGK